MFWFLGRRNADGTLAEAPLTIGSKRIILSMAIGLIMLCAYIVTARGESAPAAGDLAGWAHLMFAYIAIGIVIIIAAMVLFHILYSILIAIWQREEDEATVNRMISSAIVEDERDELISLKAMRIGYRIAGVGMVLMLVALMRGMSPVVALHILMGASFLGCFAEGIASIIYHERGV